MAKGADDRGAEIWRQIDEAAGYQSDTLQKKREQAQAYYNGEMEDPGGKDRSSIVSKDVADTVHSVHAKVIPILKTSVVEFVPEGSKDEQAAELESNAVAARIKSNSGDLAIWRAVYDGLVMGTGWLSVTEQVEYEPFRLVYDPMTEEQVNFLLLEVPTEWNPTIEQTEESTILSYEQPHKMLVIDSIPTENMIYTPRAGGDDLDQLPLIGERKIKTVQELIDDGYSRADVEALQDYQAENVDRRRSGAEGAHKLDDRPTDPDQVMKEIYCVYIRDGSGLSYAVVGKNGKLLKEEPAEFQEYVRCSPIPNPHRVEGQGMYDMVSDIQDGKTDILRNMIDASLVNTLGRYGVIDGMVNYKDAVDGRVTGVVRMRSRDAMFPLMEDAGNIERAISALNYLDQVRGERGAEALDMTEADAQIMSASATAAAGVRAAAEATVGWYAGNMATFFLRGFYQAVHRTLASMGQSFEAKVNGKWVLINPSNWSKRNNLVVHVGQTSEQRGRRIAALREMLQLQTAAIQSGGEGILTDYSKLYNTAADWIKAADLGEVSDFLIDPSSQEAQQARQAVEMQSQQQQQAMEDTQKRMIALTAQTERYKTDMQLVGKREELRYKYFDSFLESKMKELEITAEGMVEVEKMNVQDEAREMELANRTGPKLETVGNE